MICFFVSPIFTLFCYLPRYLVSLISINTYQEIQIWYKEKRGFAISLGYTEKSRPTWTIQQDAALNKQTKDKCQETDLINVVVFQSHVK